VQMLQEAKMSSALSSRFEIDALPEAGRTYHRYAGDDNSEQTQDYAKTTPDSPTPSLFQKKADQSPPKDVNEDTKTSKNTSEDDKSDEKPQPKKGFWGKITGFTSKE
jgi:hypothetical protein